MTHGAFRILESWGPCIDVASTFPRWARHRIEPPAMSTHGPQSIVQLAVDLEHRRPNEGWASLRNGGPRLLQIETFPKEVIRMAIVCLSLSRCTLVFE